MLGIERDKGCDLSISIKEHFGDKLVSSETISHKGVVVEQYVIKQEGNLNKLIWIMSPGNSLRIVCGEKQKDNPFVHADYIPAPPDEDVSRKQALSLVQEKFDQYWEL